MCTCTFTLPSAASAHSRTKHKYTHVARTHPPTQTLAYCGHPPKAFAIGLEVESLRLQATQQTQEAQVKCYAMISTALGRKTQGKQSPVVPHGSHHKCCLTHSYSNHCTVDPKPFLAECYFYVYLGGTLHLAPPAKVHTLSPPCSQMPLPMPSSTNKQECSHHLLQCNAQRPIG